MSQIFELFGYPLSAQSEAVTQGRQFTRCPFGGGLCDGGDSRHLPMIKFSKKSELAAYFEVSKIKHTPAGVCSIQVDEGQSPWIVCSRRLLALGSAGFEEQPAPSGVETKLFALLGYASGTRLGIWHKLRVPVPVPANQFTFEYVVVPVADVPLRDLYETLPGDREEVEQHLRHSGYTFAVRNGIICTLDYPVGQPSFIEVLPVGVTRGSSAERTQIAQAFEDALLGKPHTAPAVNLAPTYARLVEQLVVKSQAALACGGKLVWVVQDKLAAEISLNTALNLNDHLADQLDEVNLLSVAYDDPVVVSSPEAIQLTRLQLFAGPLAPAVASFQDLARTTALPSQEVFRTSLLARKKLRQWTVA